MFESLASCFAAYKPSLGWWKSHRLRGFAFRCSPSLNMTVQKTAHHSSPANGNHFAIRLVVISEIMFPRLSLNHIEKELFQLFITGTRAQRLHDIELQIAAKARAQLSIARKPQLVAVLAEMQVRHCADETNVLGATWNLIVSGRTVC